MNVETLPQIADLTIEQVFESFLAEQRKRLKPNTVAKYEGAISLLQIHLDGYAYEGLSKAESSLYERHYEAEGDEHRDFCQLFGPEKIMENVGSFFGYFLPNKVMGSAELSRSAGTVVKKLSKWLADQGYVDEESAKERAEQAAESGRDLARAENAAEALYASIKPLKMHPDEIPDEDWIEFDHHPISRIEPGKLWLKVYGYGEEPITLGPVSVPHKATGLLQDSWEIGCSLARINGNWQIVEMGNVHP